MVSFHALFSLGGMIGSGMGGVAAAAHIDPFIHLAVAGLLLAVAAAFAPGACWRICLARCLSADALGSR
jgi:hypothetical protein